MRAKILLPLTILALGVTILLLEAPPALTQPPSKKGKSSYKFDPNQIFDKMAQGRDFFIISEMWDRGSREQLTLFAKNTGITNDKITREQYLKFFEVRDDIRATVGFDRMAQGKNFFVISAMSDRGDKAEMTMYAKQSGITDDKITREQYLKFLENREQFKAGVGFEKYAQGKTYLVISQIQDRDRRDELTAFAKNTGITDDKVSLAQYQKYLEMRDQIRKDEQSERLFRGYDRNGDGVLNEAEIQATQNFKSQWQKWDSNKDSKITLEEWRVYMTGSVPAAQDPKNANKAPESTPAKPSISSGIDVITIDEANRSDNWRAGKLPELPGWFKDCDKNADGQVAMYEWKAKDKPLAEFLAMDANDDGLLTPDEVVRFLRQAALAAARTNGQTTPPPNNDSKSKKRK